MGATKEGFYFQLDHSPDVIVGFTGLPSTLSKNQMETVLSSVSQQSGGPARIATYADFTKDDIKTLWLAYPSSQRAPDLKTEFVFFGGPKKAYVEIAAQAVENVSADMVVLDRQLKPLFTTDVTLLVPARR
jgi:hypothetical protein